jgi:hypothetical protein
MFRNVFYSIDTVKLNEERRVHPKTAVDAVSMMRLIQVDGKWLGTFYIECEAGVPEMGLLG